MPSSTVCRDAEPEVSDWASVTNRFLEYRGHGATLSSKDLQVLEEWHRLGITPKALATAMDELRERCYQRGTQFPTTLRALERRLKLLKTAEAGGDHGLAT
jgi:GNAT superfamily N-acetyltransferase